MINGIRTLVINIIIIGKHATDAVVQQPAMQSGSGSARVPTGERKDKNAENKDTHEIIQNIGLDDIHSMGWWVRFRLGSEN